MPNLPFETKTSVETKTIAFDFTDKLPTGVTPSSGTVAALDLYSGEDKSTGGSSVIGSTTATITGNQAKVLARNGVDKRRYKITFTVTLSDATIAQEAVILLVKDL